MLKGNPIRYQRLSDDECLKSITELFSSHSQKNINTYFLPLLLQLQEVDAIWELCHYRPILDEVINCFKRISATFQQLDDLKEMHFISNTEQKLLDCFPVYGKERRNDIDLIHARCDEIKLHWSRFYLTKQMICLYEHVKIITAYIDKAMNPNTEATLFVTNFAASINHQSWLRIVANSKDFAGNEGVYQYRPSELEQLKAFLDELSNLSQQSQFWKLYFKRGSVDNNLQAMANLIYSENLASQESFKTLTAPSFYLYFKDLISADKSANLKALSENLDLCLQLNQARVLYVDKQKKSINGEKQHEGHSFSYISNRLASNENPLRVQSVSNQRSQSAPGTNSANAISRPQAIQSNHSSFFKFAVGIAAVAAATVVCKSLFRPK